MNKDLQFDSLCARALTWTNRVVRCGVVAALALSLWACSSNPKPKKAPQRFPNYGYQEQPSKEMAEQMPWELWQPFQDLKGGQLSNKSLILGDELLQRGKRQSALDAYLKADTDSLDPVEREAAVIRIASQHLALDKPTKALSAIGSFFKRNSMSEDQVDVPFALVLAFAYGRHGDVDQSLAWFSRVSTQGRPGGPGVRTAATGTTLLLRTLSQEQFDRIAVNWRADTFITEQVGKERFRRTSPGYDPDDVQLERPFWVGFGGASLVDQGSGPQQGAGGPLSVGLVLSLSDRFGALGRDTKQGFDLAIQANNPKISVVARDVGADSAAASAAVRELAAGSGVSVIAGPLLTEAAVAAAQTAREVRVPLVSFSKSESFSTGDGIFRLGATSTSQVDALVNSAFGDYGISRFAIAYPQSGAGTEFLEAYRSKLGALGLSLELEVSYTSSDDASLMEVAQKLEGSSAEAVLLPDTIEVSERLLRQFSPSLRKRMRPLGTALWDNATKIARSQALFERAVFVTPFFAQSTRSEVQGFIESYRGKYNTAPNFLAAQGFDAGTLIANALAARDRSGSSFEQALLQMPPYNGVTGVIRVQPTGEVSRKFYVVEVMRDTFQEKIPSSNPSGDRMRAAQTGSPRAVGGQAVTPALGADERVDSGY
jgi:branched-chain amino acid transport system substrate-binding protein